MELQSTWLVVEDGHTPVSHVARRAIRKRLDAVWNELQGATCPTPDPERVHRLRVATRRTLAAFAAFADLMPARRRAWFEKRLRRLRRVAGEARDIDVLADRIGREPIGPQAPAARERLVAMLSRQRDASRAPIRRLRDELAAADWHGRAERLLERIGATGRDRPFGSYARRGFQPLVERFFAKADRRLRTDDEIHRLRIQGKKLRYALEIFACVFPPRERARCADALERLQATLGEFTDHAAAADRLRRWSRSGGIGMHDGGLSAMREHAIASAARARKAFVRWWNPSRRRWLRRRLERTLRRRCA